MGWEQFARYAAWAALIALCVGGVYYAVGIIHDNGRKVERGICDKEIAKIHEDQATADAAAAKELGLAMKRVADANEERLKQALKDKDDAQKIKDALAKRRAADANLVLYIPPTSTGGTGDPSAVSGPCNVGNVDDAAKGTRLPEEITRSLQSIVYDAQQDANDFNELSKRCTPGAIILP